MKNQINYLKIILNIFLFFVYMILVSILFSFIFPLVLVILWKSVLAPWDPIFDKIQISIFILVFVVTIIYRKTFYTSINKQVVVEEKESSQHNIIENIQKQELNEKKDIVSQDYVINIEKNNQLDVSLEDWEVKNQLPDLDIKIWKVIR